MHTVQTVFCVNVSVGWSQIRTTGLLDGWSTDTSMTHKARTKRCFWQAVTKSQQNRPSGFCCSPLANTVCVRMCVWVCGNFLCVCVCVPCVSGSEKLISTQATSKWVRKAERECEMHACVSSVKCLSNSRYHTDSCQWYRSLGGRLWLVRQGV